MARSLQVAAEFSKIRFDLMRALDDGKITEQDRKAFEFLYKASSKVLHIPQFYREFSTAICLAVAASDANKPPRLQPRDLSATTKPLVDRFVKNIDTLIEEFAHPLLLFGAYVNGKRVLELMVNLQARRHARIEVERKQEELRAWREAGAQALAA
jgi:hypothetical protein